MPRESEWEYLLGLNGVEMFLDEPLCYWVKFVVHRVPTTFESPHGITYSLTLHDRAVASGVSMGSDSIDSRSKPSQNNGHGSGSIL